ncbi:MAG: hypothetical protein R3Y21_03015 [Mycoplasmatota bacterium]
MATIIAEERLKREKEYVYYQREMTKDILKNLNLLLSNNSNLNILNWKLNKSKLSLILTTINLLIVTTCVATMPMIVLFFNLFAIFTIARENKNIKMTKEQIDKIKNSQKEILGGNILFTGLLEKKMSSIKNFNLDEKEINQMIEYYNKTLDFYYQQEDGIYNRESTNNEEQVINTTENISKPKVLTYTLTK